MALAASIIGQEFSFELVEALVSLESSVLAAALERLVQSDMVAQRGEPQNAIYNWITFEFALKGNAPIVIGARRRHIDNDSVLDADEIIEPVAELHLLVGVGSPC